MGARLSAMRSCAQPMVGARTRSSDENREGEMKRELSGMGLYEDGMTAAEMDHMLQAYNESMNNSGEMSRQDSLSMEIPSTPPAEGTNHKPPRSARDSTSPELPSAVLSSRQKVQNKKPPEAEAVQSPESPSKPGVTIGTLHVLSPSPPRFGAPGAAPEASQPPQDPPNIPKKTQSVQPKLRSLLQAPKIEMWKIDPWDPHQEKDVPLKKLQRFQGSRPPVKFKMVDGVPQIPEELKKFVDMSLMECHRSHYENHRDEYSHEVVWGSPIKAATGPWNGSLDKDFRPEREIPAVRPGLRSQSQEKSLTKSGSSVFSFNTSDDDEDFETTRKRPKSSGFRPLAPRLSLPGRRGRTAPRPTQSPIDEEEPSKSDDKDPDWEERPKSTPSRKRPLKSRDSSAPEVARSTREASPEFEPQEIPPELRGKPSNSPDVADVSSVYPRRVPPPNPSRLRGPRGRKPAGVAKLLSNRPQLSVERVTRRKPEPSLTPDEIEAMMTDDEDDSPIFVAEKTSKRAEAALALLERAKEEEANEERKKQDLEKSRRAQEDRAKQERIQRRIRAEQQLMRAKESIATLEKERGDKYKAGGQVRLGRRPELEGDSARKTARASVLNWDADNRPTPTADEVEDMFTATPEGRQDVQCPICSKYFPQGQEIETHADTCVDSFGDGNVVDVEEDGHRTPPSGRQSAGTFECFKCGRYWTRDGHEFEEHMSKCIKDGGTGSSRTAPINIPDSPIRCFKPLSKIENSQIDYCAQTRTRKPSPRGGGSRKRRKQS
ncbi:centrosomal protein of 164 kDa isoform X2 [Diachasma alloeum]|uniref:centrosomal protein of 164 kDa isoform X2 n=1 Tax=Diachasma alloeum TaxID=454923 RepID=UPI00073825B1|nr:centrosomal protein of 164 kDa isoform X2 [Diachasma alloeum]